MTDDVELARLDAELAAAREKRDEAYRAASRAQALRRQGDECSARCDALAASLAKEQRDVDRMEGISLTRVVVALSGRGDERVDRERAERDAAALRLATERSTLAALRKDFESASFLASQANATQAAYAQALAAKQQCLESRGDPRAVQLHDLTQQLAQLSWQAKEIGEARAAARAALVALDDVAGRLDSAANWSAADMVGGGLIASAVKHSRLDEASNAAANAQNALQALARELGDIGGTVDQRLPDISGSQRLIDVWFDNIFTDWSVNRKINESRSAIAETIGRVRALDAELARRHGAVDEATRQLDFRRRQILDPTV